MKLPGQPLQGRYFGPYVVVRTISVTDYIVLTPGHRKQTRLCHINMPKEYHERKHQKNVASYISIMSVVVENEQSEDCSIVTFDEVSPILKHSDLLSNLHENAISFNT